MPAPAAGQAEVERLRDLFTADAMSRIDAIADRAERDGIPRRLVMDKALEGAAKGASPEQVLNTLSDYVRELRGARQVVGEPASPDVLVAAADAMRRGVDRSDVRALAADRPGDLAIVLLAVGDLTQEGVASSEARRLVEEARQAGWRGDQLLTLSAAVRRLMREGASASEAAEAVRRDLRDGGNLP